MKQINKSSYSLISFILGVIAVGMIFLPAILYSDTDSSFTGIQAVFGTEFASLGIFGSGQIELNILCIIAFALPVLAGIIAVLYNNGKGAIISLALFTVGTVLLFLLPSFVTATVTVLGETSAIDVSWTMGYGLIIAACASICGAIISLAKLMTSGEKNN